MYNNWKEITLIFNSTQLRDRSYLEISIEGIYSIRELNEFEIINIGYPISSDASLLNSIITRCSFSFKIFTFSYIDLIDKKSIDHSIRMYSQENNFKIIYFKASEKTDWNAFLNSVWDLAKIGTEIRLLDSNQIFSQNNALKKINSLVMRGVILGFYPNFPKKWYQSEVSAIKNVAKLKLVDFWMCSVHDIVSNNFKQSFHRKKIYNQYLDQ